MNNIMELCKGYTKEIQNFNDKCLSTMTAEQLMGFNTTIKTFYKLEFSFYDISEFILKIFKNINFEKTETPLQKQFLFTGDKILFNSENIEITQGEFNNYLQSQLGFILSGRWANVNKPSNVDKNTALLWIGRFNFDNVQISYNAESIAKLCTRNKNKNIKISVPTLEEKQIIFDNLINSNSPIIQRENQYYNVIRIYLNLSDNYLDNALSQFERKNNSYKLTGNKYANYTDNYKKISELKVRK